MTVLAKTFSSPLQTACELSATTAPTLASFCEPMDKALGGGLPHGSLIEWGAPIGSEGRQLLLPFLANSTYGMQSNPSFCLWANGHKDLAVFPPAWIARGICPSRLVFADGFRRLEDIKRVFASPLFGVVVVDLARGQSCHPSDYLYLRQQASLYDKIIIVLRPYFLSNKRGNPAARLRLNSWRDHKSGIYHLRLIKGHSPAAASCSNQTSICFDANTLEQATCI